MEANRKVLCFAQAGDRPAVITADCDFEELAAKVDQAGRALIALGIGIGTSSVIARSVGAGGTSEVQRLGTHAMLLVFFSMAV